MAQRRTPTVETRIALALLVLAWLNCAASALTERIDRDEHMYLAAARLSGEHAIYEDFAFLQTPYSAGVYRAVLSLAPDPWVLLPARLFKVALSAVMIGVLFFALRRMGARPLLAGGLIALLYLDDTVRDMAALARNYDLAQLSILAGLCIVPLREADPGGRIRLLAVGALAVAAVGFKLTYAPLAALLVAWPVIRAPGGRTRRALWLALGLVLGAAPGVVTMAGVELATLRLNLLEYHFLNAELHAAYGNEPLATLWDRISRALGTLLARNHRPLLAMCVFALALNLARWSRPRAWVPGPRAWFAVIFLAGALAMAAVPRPIQDAYFLAAFCGMTLFVAVATGRLTPRGQQTMLALCLSTVALTIAVDAGRLGALLRDATDPDEWTGIVAHRTGEQLAAAATPGPALTTHPIFALEAGLELYPELATGEFTWRVGTLLGAERRRLLHSTSEDSLDSLVAGRPPGAVITESGSGWDGALERWAREHGFEATPGAYPNVLLWSR